MNTTIIRASIHVPTDCDVSMRISKLKTDDKKYAVLSLGLDNATIFIKNSEKALEIARLLVLAAQELESEK